MSHVLRIGVVDQIAMFRAFDNDPQAAKTDLTSATTGLTLSVFRTNLAPVSIASLSDKAADNTAHADGAIRHVGGNLYTVDLPDAATANQCPSIGVVGSYTGGVIEPVPHPIVNYDPSLVAVGANTEASKAFTFGSGPTIQIADTANRQITWPTASETITGTIQWDGQVSKAITGAITFRETISGNHFYDWAYNAADRPPVPGYAVIQFTDGVFTDDPLVVGFVSAPTVSAFEARTLPSADYFVVGDFTEPPTVEDIQSGLATEAKQDTAKTAIDAILVGTDETIPATLANMSGATFDTETDSLEAIRDRGDEAWAGGGASVNVLPAVGIVADRSPGATISPVVGETISQSITLYQTDGTTPVDLAGKTLAIVFETMAGVDVAVVANADITISGDYDNVVTFAYPSAVTASERTLRFAIKDEAAPLTEYLKGLCNVTSGPRVDA